MIRPTAVADRTQRKRHAHRLVSRSTPTSVRAPSCLCKRMTVTHKVVRHQREIVLRPTPTRMVSSLLVVAGVVL